MSIRSKIILILFLSLAALAACVAAASHLQAGRESDAAFRREASAQLDRVDDSIHLYFRGAEEAVRNLAALPETRKAAPVKGAGALTAHDPANPPGSLADSLPGTLPGTLADTPADAQADTPNGTPVPANTLGDANVPLQQRLAMLPALVPGVEAAFCGYRNGLFLSSSVAGPDSRDARTQPWYARTAWGVTDTSVTDVTISETSKSLVATVAAKIKDDTGETLGVAALAITLAPLSDALRDIRLGRTGYLVLFDADGRVLFDPKAQENLLRPAAEANEGYLPLVQLPPGFHRLTLDGVAMAALSRQFDGSRWKASIIMDQAEQAGPGNRAAWTVTGIAAIAALALGLLGTVLAFGATRPLYALIRQSKALAEGNDDALAGIPGRGPDITALQGNIGQLTGRVILLAQSGKEHAHRIESYARKALAAGQEQTDRSARDAYHAACGNAAKAVAPVAEQAGQTLAALKGRTGTLEKCAERQVQAATNARAATKAVLDEALILARQAAETEKNAEAALLLGQKTEKLQQDTARSLESAEEAAKSLAPGLDGFRADAERMASQTAAVRDLAEEVNVMGLKLSIEVSSAGDAGRPFLPMTEQMRSLAEKMMAAAGKMEDAIAAIDQTHAAHALAVGKNATVVRRVAAGAAKTGTALAKTMGLAATTLEQIRVLATALEGMAQAEGLGPDNADTCLGAARDAEEALENLRADTDALTALAANLAAIADTLAAGPEEGEIILTTSRSGI